MDDEVFILFPSRFPSQRYLRAVIFVVFLQKFKLKVLQMDKMQIIYVTMYIMWYLIAYYRELKEFLSRGENSYAFHIHTVPYAIRSILGSTDCRDNNSFVLPNLTFKPFDNKFYRLHFKLYWWEDKHIYVFVISSFFFNSLTDANALFCLWFWC